MTNPEGQNVRGGRSYTCNEKDGLTRKKWGRKKRPSGCSLSYSSSILSEPQRSWMNPEFGMINENLGKHEEKQ